MASDERLIPIIFDSLCGVCVFQRGEMMKSEAIETPLQKKIERATLLKGAAATAATVATSGVATQIARAAGRIEAPYVRKSPSGTIHLWNAQLFSAQSVAAFNKVYPDVKVIQAAKPYVPGTPSLSAQLVTGIDVPDAVHFIEDAFLGQYADVLYDVGPYLEPYASKITPFKLAVSKQGGRTVGIPWDVCPSLLIYHEGVIAKAGVDVSKIRTYADLLAAAIQVKKNVPSCTTPICFNQTPSHLTFSLEGLAWQQHTGIIDAHGNLQLASAAYTRAFSYFEAIGKAGLATIVPWQTPTLYNTWNQGKTAFMCFADWWTHWNSPGLKAAWGKVGLRAQPVFNVASDSPYSNMGGSAYVVPRKAKRPDLAALFGTFQLYDPRALKASNNNDEYAGLLPASEGLWDLVNIRRPIIDPAIDEHKLLTTAARSIPASYRYPAWFSRTFPYIGPQVSNLLTGHTTAKAAQSAAFNDVKSKVVARYR